MTQEKKLLFFLRMPSERKIIFKAAAWISGI